jgi:hypothetical protein
VLKWTNSLEVYFQTVDMTKMDVQRTLLIEPAALAQVAQRASKRAKPAPLRSVSVAGNVLRRITFKVSEGDAGSARPYSG